MMKYIVNGFAMKPGVIDSYIVKAYVRVKSFPIKNKRTPINGRKLLTSSPLCKALAWCSGLDKTCVRQDNGFATALARRKGKSGCKKLF